MAHSLTSLPSPTAPPISTTQRKKTHLPSLGFQRVWACHQGPDLALGHRIIHRRGTLALGLTSAVLGLSIGNHQNADAAAKRQPPPPPAEKKDPAVSGLQAKVLASKKRKEAMKDAVTKLRERGKPIDGGPSE